MLTGAYPTTEYIEEKSDFKAGKIHMKFSHYEIIGNLEVSVKLLDLIFMCLWYDPYDWASLDDVIQSDFLKTESNDQDANLKDLQEF